MEMVGRGGVVDLCSAAFLSADAAREVTEVICSQRYVGVQGFTNGFAVVPGFGDCELLQIRLDAVGDLQQDVGAILDRGASPGISSGVSSTLAVSRLIEASGCRASTSSLSESERPSVSR